MDEICGVYSSASQYTRRIFHYFGDPSMAIHTEVPQKFSPTIKRENGMISVNTGCSDTRISFYTPATNSVESYIGENINYLTGADNIIVSLNKHNHKPFIIHCDRNIYIQNEYINNERVYVGENIYIGKDVTTSKDEGNVIIQNATIELQGGNVVLDSGTTITNSNVEINTNN